MATLNSLWAYDVYMCGLGGADIRKFENVFVFKAKQHPPRPDHEGQGGVEAGSGGGSHGHFEFTLGV